MRTKKDARTKEEERGFIKAIVAAYNSEDANMKAWAIQEMLKKVQGFIGHMIDKHFPTYKKEYYDDLYNEGVIAVIEEMGRFDPDKGTLTTYFTPYILHRLNTFVNVEVNRSTPYYANIMRTIKEAQKYYSELHVKPSVADLALHTGLSVKKVEDGLKRIEATNECHYQSAVELDSMGINTFKSPEEEMLEKERNQLVMNAVSKLEELDRQIIALRFGLYDDNEKSFAEIAKALGLPVNRVMNSVNRSIRIMSTDKGLKNLENKRKSSTLSKTELSYMPDESMARVYDCLDDDFDDEFEIGLKVNVKAKKEKNEETEDKYFILTI